MTIYKSKANYRKIWESSFGPIPVDKNGRSYEIHHLDGDRDNNSLSNLACVTIQEHFDIHYDQEDWGACQAIMTRMIKTPEQISKETSELMSGLMTKENKRRVDAGTHNFLKRPDGSSLAKDEAFRRVGDGTHHFLTRGDGTSLGREVTMTRIADGTHNFGKEFSQKLTAQGKNPFLTRPDGTNIQTDKVFQGIHNLQNPEHHRQVLEKGLHSSQRKVTCLCCKTTTTVSQFTRYHDGTCGQLHPHNQVTCLSCKWTVDVNNYSRWHGTNCHMNPDGPRYNPDKKPSEKRPRKKR